MNFSLKTYFKGPFVSEKPPKQSLEWEIKQKEAEYVMYPRTVDMYILWKNFTPEPYPKKLPKILDFTVLDCKGIRLYSIRLKGY